MTEIESEAEGLAEATAEEFESEKTDAGAATGIPPQPVVTAQDTGAPPPALPPHAFSPPGPPRPVAPPSANSSGLYPAPSLSHSGPLPNVLQESGAFPAYGQQGGVPLSPTGEFGMIPDIGMQSNDSMAVVAPPPPPRTRRLRAVIASLVVGIIAFVVVARVIVDQWADPTRAVLWMTAGTVLPTVLVGVLLSWPNRDDGSLRDLLSGVVPGIVLSIAAIAVAGFWSQPSVRMLAIPFAPETPPLMTMILEDPDEDVAVAGCERFAHRHEAPDFRVRLFSLLTLRPSIATKCMEKLPEAAQVAIATSLSDRWTRELLAEADDPDQERLCKTAGGLSSLPISGAVVRGRLLQCTFSAPSTIAQQCCAESLAAMVVHPKQWAQQLADSIPYVAGQVSASGIFAMAFHKKNLTQPQLDFAKKVNFESPQVQLAGIQLACESIAGGRTDVVRDIQATLDGQCPINAAQIPNSRAVWQEICFLATAELEADLTRPPVSVLCMAAQDVAAGAAVEQAMSLVRLGLRKDIEGSLARQIDGGYNMLVSELTAASQDQVPDFVDENDIADARARKQHREDRLDKAYQFTDPSDAELKQFVDAYREQQPWRERKKFLEREGLQRKK